MTNGVQQGLEAALPHFTKVLAHPAAEIGAKTENPGINVSDHTMGM